MSTRPAPADAAAVAPPLGDALEFLRLIWAIDQGLQKASKRMERSLGVTGPQRLVLRLAGRYPGLTLGRLAAALHVHPSTVSGIVQRLEKRGLLSRDADSRDRRRAYLGLTPAGRRLTAQDNGTIEAAVQRALASVSPSAAAGARDVLAALAHELTRE